MKTNNSNKKTAPEASTEPETVSLPKPPRGMIYALVPEDVGETVKLTGITSLCRLEGGDLVRELSETLADLVSQSMARGKKSALSIAFAIKPEGTKRIGIAARLKAEPPKQEAVETTLFADVQGRLFANDPEQLELNLKVVPIDEQPSSSARKVIAD